MNQDSGAPMYFAGQIQDFSAPKAAEAALRASEQRFRLLSEQASDLVRIVQGDGTILYASPSHQRILGYAPADLVGRASFDFIHPDDLPSMLNEFNAAIFRGDAVITSTYRMRHADGSWRMIEVTATNHLDDPVLRGLIVNGRDVTDRLAMEAALRASERRFRTLIEKSFDGVVLADAEGRAQYVSPSLQRILGFSEAELLGSAPLDVVHPADLPTVLERLQDLLQRPGQDSRMVYRICHKDGSYRWIEVVASNLTADPSVAALVLNLRDITEQRHAELAHERLAAIVASSSDAIIGHALDGTIDSWNAGASHLYGYAPAEILGERLAVLVPPERVAELTTLLDTLQRGGSITQYETVHRRRDGTLLDVSLTMSPIRGSAGVDAAATIARDIGHRKLALREAERARAAAEDLARMRSDFVASVSHELRSPLTAIVGFGELLQERWDQLSEAKRLERIGHIVQAANRQKDLVEDLLLLSRLEGVAPAPQRHTVALAALVHQAVAEVKGSYPGQRIALRGATSLRVQADPSSTVQILANVLDNAAKYSPEGRSIRVTWGQDNDMVVVRVMDRGSGVPVEGREQLFTRFGRIPGSRIREGRVGTGLGLYLSKRLAEAMAGDLDLESSGPEGSTFRLRLPAAQ